MTNPDPPHPSALKKKEKKAAEEREKIRLEERRAIREAEDALREEQRLADLDHAAEKHRLWNDSHGASKRLPD